MIRNNNFIHKMIIRSRGFICRDTYRCRDAQPCVSRKISI